MANYDMVLLVKMFLKVYCINNRNNKQILYLKKVLIFISNKIVDLLD